MGDPSDRHFRFIHSSRFCAVHSAAARIRRLRLAKRGRNDDTDFTDTRNPFQEIDMSTTPSKTRSTRSPRIGMTGAASFKAFAFGIGATLAIAFSLLHVQDQREQRAAVITLDPVVITAKRTQLPTVYITGRRDTSADGQRLASAAQVGCTTQLC
ncbi:hypothetical protein CDL60_26120 [Roseateles noduli]|nr:hypothetical protein CDL60_26120 [Roseateles noduli]